MRNGVRTCLLVLVACLMHADVFAAVNDVSNSGDADKSTKIANDVIEITVPIAGMPVREADRFFPLDVNSSVQQISPDGRVAYLYMDMETFDLASLLHDEIVALAGIVSAFFFLILLWRTRRSAMRRLIAGEKYCRKCAYHLRGCQAEDCPECGTKLTPRNQFVMPSRRRRVLRFAVCFMVIATPVLAAHLFTNPLQVFIEKHVRWHSPSLANWVNSREWTWWQDHYLESSEGIRAVDLDTGETLFEVHYGIDEWIYDSIMVCAMDSIFVQVEDYRDHVVTFEKYDGRTGEHLATVWSCKFISRDPTVSIFKDGPTVESNYPDLIAVTSDAGYLYMTQASKLKRVEVATGTVETVLENVGAMPQREESSAYRIFLPDAMTYLVGDRLIHLDGYDQDAAGESFSKLPNVRLRVWDMRTLAKMGETQFADDGQRLAALSADGRSIWAFEPGPSTAEMSEEGVWGFSADDQQMRRHYLDGRQADKAVRFAVVKPVEPEKTAADLEIKGDFHSFAPDWPDNQIWIPRMPDGAVPSPDGRFLFIYLSAAEERVLVWDLKREQVVVQLNAYEAITYRGMFLSRDGKRLTLISPSPPTGKAKPGQDAIAVFELEAILPDP